MQPILPRAADLWNILHDLHGHTDQRKLIKLAVQAQRAQSCVADLKLAETTCETLAQIEHCDLSAMTPLHRLALQHALVANAVVLYARATSTHSSGGERGSVSIDDRLQAGDLADHKMLVTLRNKVIAHVHAEEAIADNVWHRERMILRESGLAWRPGCVTRRMQIDQVTIAKLRKMIPIAYKLVRETYLKRLNSLTSLVNIDPPDLGLIEKHLFDAVAFFGSVKAAQHALSLGSGKSAAGLVE
jgi:hypothetical protein